MPEHLVSTNLRVHIRFQPIRCKNIERQSYNRNDEMMYMDLIVYNIMLVSAKPFCPFRTVQRRDHNYFFKNMNVKHKHV